MNIVIDVTDCYGRLSTDKERPSDRRMILMFAMGEWRRRWRAAEAINDYDLMDRLNRQYDSIVSL
jgi:hypothetical protein